ncbi:iron ABC transporter permease [Marinomonas sp. C2222]|uniref:Iron ABC transporter permease n=1 Tax=Marinomonas sargassi TaxID=2984494 RepID=A0ABT2YV36_9GAMM|nr:iron ABC transporter permease [Marinomonas sargassi]MCV2403752.1 iron ABC transporter permease [Marinomonas sargassi]
MPFIQRAKPQEGQTLASQYRQYMSLRLIILLALAVGTLLTLVYDLSEGPSSLSFLGLLQGLWSPDSLPITQQVIIWDIRLPYALMAILVGAALGLAGAEMQTALNNPLASPFTLGVGSAATFGASLAIVFDLSHLGISQNFLLPVCAFAFAGATSLIILGIANNLGGSIHSVLLFGIALMFGLNAMVGVLQFVADEGQLQQIVFWTMGSLARADIEKASIVAIVLLVCLVFSLRNAWAMTLLRSGEEQAKSMGINVKRLRVITLLRVSLLTAVALAFVGEIGFIGLVAPHIARMIIGESHRLFLIGSALCGALLLSLASIASKSVISGLVLPIGMVTALVGIPFFITLIYQHQKRNTL